MEQTTFFTELVYYFLGGMSLAYLVARMIFLLIGAMLNIGLDVFNRDEGSTNTPVTFSWAFFWKKNWWRCVLNILAAYSVVRLFSDIFPGLEISLAWAWMIGLAFDWIWVALREIKYMAVNKLKEAMKKFKKS